MKIHSVIFAVILIFSVTSAFAAPREFAFSTAPGTDGLCSAWAKGRYAVDPQGIRLDKNKYCYNASVIPLRGVKNVRISFKYQGTGTECGLFIYSGTGLRGRDLHYLPNTKKLREFTGDFPIPDVVDKKRPTGIRIVFRTTGNALISDVKLLLPEK
ncbi:MAG: hypothetical protein IJS01_06660 [Lentisphaeria bacterium]|nr:hypothetical protein [Lentisphaeria bacterium]